MKRIHIIFAALAILVAISLSACAPERTAEDIKRDQQEVSLKEGTNQVGMPAITNFREAKTMRMIQELCDQEIVTYAYLENLVPTVVRGRTALGGKFTFLGETIGFPIPYSAQFTAPEAIQTYNLKKTGSQHYYGAERLPLADPNGLYKPSSSEATWVLLKDPNSGNVAPIYMEPRLMCSPFKFPVD
ncbi:MAG: hypothetical protein WCX12_02755 [Candidatus Paceibacterota bacterium]